jgi:uncharacterized protein YjbJ (UPF0337 family)
VDRRLCIRQGDSPREDLACPDALHAQGDLNGSRRIETHHRTEERIKMKPSTDDKATGKLHEVKGAVKQTAGEITQNPDLEADGRTEKNAGKVQNAVGKIEKAVGA